MSEAKLACLFVPLAFICIPCVGFDSNFKVKWVFFCGRSNLSKAGTRSVGSLAGGLGREDLIVDFVLYGAGRRIERGESSYSARLVDP